MARNINPRVELEPRDSDVSVPEDLFPKLPPFSQLKTAPSLHKFPGSLRLRRFAKGEVICRQGDAGWTAFYIPNTKELVEYRDAAERQLPLAAEELAKAEKKKAELEQKIRDASGDPKQLMSLKDKLEEAEVLVEDWHKKINNYKEALPYLKREIVLAGAPEKTELVLEAGRQASQRLEERRQRATAEGDAAGAALYRGLIGADPAEKRVRADALVGTEPELAQWLRAVAEADELRLVADVRLSVPRSSSRPKAGFFAKIKDSLFGKGVSAARAKPSFIPINGPRDLNYGSPVGVLNEGELFGEMSCRYRTPRSATVIATRDCYMLEMLRNVLEMMLKDATLKAHLDQLYRDRVLESQLRAIPIMSLLDDRLLERVRRNADLVECNIGSLIYDEHDAADGMHLIRSGIIQVMTNVSYLLSVGAISEWGEFQEELVAGQVPETGPSHRIWGLLPETLRTALVHSASGTLAANDALKSATTDALNALLKDPGLTESAGLQNLARESKAGRKTWRLLSASLKGSERDMERCQRRLLESLFNKFPVWASSDPNEDASYLFRVDEVSDWKVFCASLSDGSEKTNDPRRSVWDRLPEPIRALADKAKKALKKPDDAKKIPKKESGPEVKTELELTPADKDAVIAALNEILQAKPFLLDPEFQDHVRSAKGAAIVKKFLPNEETWSPHDFERYTRAYNRLLLDAVYPKGLAGSKRPSGPPMTLAYRSRGEHVGEMALLSGQPRRASCVAFGHMEDDPEREVGTVQLVRISRDLFEELKRESPSFRSQLEVEVARRVAEEKNLRTRASKALAPTRAHTGRAEELGLIQGQKLMLIDLDRCTRCDECVSACVSSHDDGRSRLYLDGPRYADNKYLVPATCRSCLDPVCMIGCPVGSIHRGGNNEIIIEDWCIGCGACADQCPYASIQMHPVGVIPGSSHGWRYQVASAVPADWFQPARSDRSWSRGHTPFIYDRDFQAALRELGGSSPGKSEAVCFRYAFDVDARLLGPGHHFVLILLTLDEDPSLWINGESLVPGGGQEAVEVSKAKSRRDAGGFEFEVRFLASRLRTAQNVVAVRAAPARLECDQLLELFLDHEESASVRLVEEKAVVCDLCSSLPGQDPACVKACPHDAAIRINARTELSALCDRGND